MSVWDVVVAIAEAFGGDSSSWRSRRDDRHASRRADRSGLSGLLDIPVSVEFQRASWFQRPDGSWLRWEASANSWVEAPQGPPPEMAELLGVASPPGPEAAQLTLPVGPDPQAETAAPPPATAAPPPAATPSLDSGPSPATAGPPIASVRHRTPA